MNIPTEIIDHISTYIPERRHQASLALVNKAWNLSITAILYRDIDLDEFSHRPVQPQDSGGLPQMSGITFTLAKNPSLSSLVHYIRHSFCVGEQPEARRQSWEVSLLRIRSNLQEILDRNGFPQVKRLDLFSPDIEIADILLRGLLPQVRYLQITSPFIRYLKFDTEESSSFRNLEEVEFGFSQDIIRGAGSNLLNDKTMAAIKEYSLAGGRMNSRLNTFFSLCPSLRILKINKTKELHTLLGSITFPFLKVLEIGPVLNQQIDFAVDSLNSFLGRHPSISRLALHNLPNETSNNMVLSETSRLGVREFLSHVEEIPSDYFTFVRQFQRLETYRLHYHIIVGEVTHNELLNLLPELQFNSPGIKNLTLPMPSHIPGWTLTEQKLEMARGALMEFGRALAEFLPTVEKFGISQIGRFFELGAADWARSFSPHPSLRSLTIKAVFLPDASADGSDGDRRGFIDQLVREFAAIPKLENFVFESMNGQVLKIEIVRLENGSVEGKEVMVSSEEIESVFSDRFFESESW